jgi:hypothetical protein
MSRYLSRLAFVPVVSVCLLIMAGCNPVAQRLSPPKVNPNTAASNAMKEFDADNDGKISGDELKKCPSLAEIADKGVVAPEKIANTIEDWQKRKCGRGTLNVQVSHNGQPLVGAKVEAVPEKFMGSDLKIGTGVTSAEQRGTAEVSVPVPGPEVPKGVTPGFYRIKITKEGETIPEKYNTETTLGVTVTDAGLLKQYDLIY